MLANASNKLNEAPDTDVKEIALIKLELAEAYRNPTAYSDMIDSLEGALKIYSDNGVNVDSIQSADLRVFKEYDRNGNPISVAGRQKSAAQLRGAFSLKQSKAKQEYMRNRPTTVSDYPEFSGTAM
jgi:hypothetical protein